MNFNSTLKKELEYIIKDHSILLTVIIAPVLYAFFMGSVYLNKDIEKIPFGVVDSDHSHLSRELTQKLAASPKINLKENLININDAEQSLKDWKIQGYIVFSKGFEKKVLEKKKATVGLYLNNMRLLPSNALNTVVNEAMLQAGTEIRIKNFQKKGIITPLAKEMANPIRPEIKPLFNATNSYGNFLLPALFFIILQQTLLLGLGESISKDRENGMFQKVLKGKSGEVFSYTFGKAFYYFILYSAYILFFTEIIFPLFHIPAKASLFPVMITGMLFIISLLLMAILIGTFIKKQAHTIEILAFTAYPLFLISGYSWPLSSMPTGVQILANLIPTTPMLEAMTKLYIMGGSWNSIVPEIIHLLLITTGLAIILFFRLSFLKKKQATEQYIKRNPAKILQG